MFAPKLKSFTNSSTIKRDALEGTTRPSQSHLCHTAAITKPHSSNIKAAQGHIKATRQKHRNYGQQLQNRRAITLNIKATVDGKISTSLEFMGLFVYNTALIGVFKNG